jgi:hypothetical protein
MVHREPCLSVGLAVEMDVKEAYPLAVESRIDRQVEPVRSAPHAFEDFFADGGGSASSAQTSSGSGAWPMRGTEPI